MAIVIERFETTAQKCSRGMLAGFVGLIAVAVFASERNPDPIFVGVISMCIGYAAWVLTPTWLVMVFDWLLVFSLIAALVTLVICFPLQVIAAAAALLFLTVLFRLL